MEFAIVMGDDEDAENEQDEPDSYKNGKDSHLN
jgi:hypothetical protein